MKKITLFIIFNFIGLLIYAQCNEPSSIQFEEFVGDNIYITWSTNGGNNWDIEYGVSGFTPTGTPTIENYNYNIFEVNQLTPSVYLDVYLRSDCGSETSNWVGPFTFFNYCTQNMVSNFIVDEYFGNNFIPFCFTETNIGTPEANYQVSNESDWEEGEFANIGSFSAKINIQGTDVNEWLILPIMTGFPGVRSSLNGDYDLRLNFNIALTEHDTTTATSLGSDDEIKLVISPDFGETWYNIRTWNADSIISNTEENIDINYLDYTNGFNLYETAFLVAFWASSGSVNDTQNVDFFIDNISAIPPSTGAIEDLKSFGFSYYPSPSKNKITLNANELINEVTIYNQLGQKIKDITINAMNKEIDISILQNGLYYMKVNINNFVGTVSLIKN